MSTPTDDRFLGGRVIVRQLPNGFRAGLDAVMLAAAVPARNRDETLELGAGAGTASLCLAARIPEVSIVGVEIEEALVSLANDNARANGKERRLRFVPGDVFKLPKELRRDFAHVFCNPPFHDARGEASPDPGRDTALRDRGKLGEWMELGLRRTISGGTFTAIIRADRLGEAMTRLPERGVATLPLWPRHGQPAKRVILQVRKGSGARPALLPGLTLHNADGTYTAEADSILREGASLALDSSRL